MASPVAEEYWRARPVLVTGAGGFIGTHLVRRLSALGARVHAVSRRPGESSNGETWHVADVADAGAVEWLVGSTRPAVVFHLASEVAGARDPRLVLPMLHSNLTSVVNLLTAVTEVPETRVVLAGSLEELRPEEGDKAPSSPYAVSKWAADGYARMFHHLWGVQVSNLRIGMVYGPGRQDTRKLVPYVALSLLRGREPELGSGTRHLDWVYVDDVVDAFLATGETPDAAGRAFDIGTGTGTSIRDTVELLSRIVGGQARPRYGALTDRALDSARIADTTAAAEILHWRPAVGLEEGLRRTVDWFARENG
ncbi:NAD-dependent epimerase/dehydratase family protein [Streptosporangium sp. NBC_01495]|uniref:NAD-dependent epimerase/dehydratase family protein n=1 Tax=Streptosporangium sp. NBC_01495 TaxID=2903899 RepID=UPI002E31A6D6|nr:NAD-dependent epimerase/dehydratase family protein [Streptosporangium sp. NBC_01495]